MVEESTGIDKKSVILEAYRNSDNKKEFCIGLAELLEESGFGQQDYINLQSNRLSKGRLPKEPILIDIYYEYARDYKSDADSETKEA